jgi:glutathione S-transferase
MATESLLLYGESRWVSPYVLSAFVVLKEKKLPFALRLLSLAKGEYLQSPYAEETITARVPALVHGSFWLSESSAIGEYLEDVFAPPRYLALYPAGAVDRARARQLQAWLRSDFTPLREERSSESVFYGLPVAPLSPDAATAAAHLLRALDRLLPPGANSIFGSFGVVDVDMALMLQRLITHGDPVSERLRAYANGVWQRPSVREFVEHPRPPYEAL